jgi:hypothetical protein
MKRFITKLTISMPGSARHLYVVCIVVFSPKYLILILFYVVSIFMPKNSRFHGKIARYDVLKIKFVDISHRRYKLRRDIE